MVEGEGRLTLHPFVGHEGLTQSLARARLTGRLPACLLIHGPRGVGKQRLALWIGELILCEAPTEHGPCGGCKACRLSESLEHPDLHWYFPIARPKGSSSPRKLAEALEDARNAALAERRDSSLQPSVGATEPTGLYLAVAQSLKTKARHRPSMSSHQVFVIGDAEALTPQESSQEAANALLKLLEEPPSSTHMILTSSEPRALLPTIRSRTLPIFLPGLSKPAVAAFLVEYAAADADSAKHAAELSLGSIGRGLGFLEVDGAPAPLDEVRRAAFRLLRTALSANRGSAFAHALKFSPAGARSLNGLLDFLEEALRDVAAIAAGCPENVINTDAAPMLSEAVATARLHPTAVARARNRIEETREMAAGNVNPQLLVFGLLNDIHEDLMHSSPTHAGEAR